MAKKKKITESKINLSWKIVSLIFLVLLLFSFWHMLIPGRMLDCGDQLLGYPFKTFAASSLRSFDGIPKWNPYIFGGFPYIGAMHGDILYPSALMRIFLPSEYVLSLIFFIHFFLAGLFSFLFARKLGADDFESLLIGILYAFTGLIISQVNPGHDGKVIVEAFTPAVFLFLTKGVDEGKLRNYLFAGGFIGLCLLAPNVQLTYYLLVGAFIWFVSELIAKCGKNWKAYIPHIIFVTFSLMLGFTIAAAQFIPFLKYSSLSPRAEGRGWEFATSWSMHPSEFFDSFIGGFSGLKEKYWGSNPFKLHTEYMGIIPLLLAPAAFFFRKKKYLRRPITFLSIAIFFLIVSFGGNTPIYRIFYSILPGFKKFRAPSISFFMFVFPMISLAAIGLKNIRENIKAKNILLVTASVLFFILLFSPMFAEKFAQETGKLDLYKLFFSDFKRSIVISSLVLISITLLILSMKKFTGKRHFAFIAIFAIAFLDLVFINGKFVSEIKENNGNYRSASDIYGKDRIVELIKSTDSLGRVIPSTYFDIELTGQGIIPKENHSSDNYLMANRLYSAGGYHGNQIQRYQDIIGLPGTIMFQQGGFLTENINLSRGMGIKFQPLSTIIYNELLRLSSENTESAIQFAYNIGLGKAGVIRILEGQTIQAGDMVLIVDTLALPRIFCVPQDTFIENDTTCLEFVVNPEFDFSKIIVLSEISQIKAEAGGTVSIDLYSPDKIIANVHADGPTYIFVNDNYAPGWTATLNGEEVDVLRANYTFRAVAIPAKGDYQLIMTYNPSSVKLGFAVSLFAILTWVISVIITSMKRKGRKNEDIDNNTNL